MLNRHAFLERHGWILSIAILVVVLPAGLVVLLPVAAIRCMDKLSRDALHEYSSVVVAPALCGLETATPLLRHHLVDLNSRSDVIEHNESSPLAAQCAEWFGQMLAVEMELALDGLEVAVLKPPQPDDETMDSYCPKCHAQFGKATSAYCTECPNVQLVAFNGINQSLETG